jgi:hypothetical protein
MSHDQLLAIMAAILGARADRNPDEKALMDIAEQICREIAEGRKMRELWATPKFWEDVARLRAEEAAEAEAGDA